MLRDIFPKLFNDKNGFRKSKNTNERILEKN